MACRDEAHAELIEQKGAQRRHVASFGLPRVVERSRVITEVRQSEIFLQQPAIRVRVCTHAARTSWRQLTNFGNNSPAGVEQLFGFVAAQPVFKQLEMRWIFPNVGDGDLMCSSRAFEFASVDIGWGRPTLGRA